MSSSSPSSSSAAAAAVAASSSDDDAGAVTAPFRVREISLLEFRCFKTLALAEPPARNRAIALVGPNGSGKTSVLEAVSLFAPGRGLRSAAAERLARRDNNGDTAPAWRVSLAVARNTNTRRLSLEAARGARKTQKLDEQKTSSLVLAETLPLLWLTPAQINLFSGPARARRAFLDRVVAVFFPEHALVLTRAERLRQERRMLLQRGGAEDAWLDSIEAGLVAETVAAAKLRRHAAARIRESLLALSPPFSRIQLSLAGDALGDSDSDGDSDGDNNSPDTFTDALSAKLRAARNHDAKSGRSAVGTHKMDFAVRFAAADAAADSAPASAVLASTGEEKHAMISLLLAAARALHAAGRSPVLLLDELVAHLDNSVSDALFAELAGLELQVWASGQELARFPSARFARCELRRNNDGTRAAEWTP
ncbi:MAG: hypothetical protein MPJ53_02200 [Alphaproteobacteria bacterium]|nr:hypothetical protein [Alphaproteobacteria bacterium]